MLVAEYAMKLDALLASDREVSDEDFVSVITLNELHKFVRLERMRELLPVTRVTISRWLDGSSLALPDVRKAILRILREEITSQECESIS